MLRKTVKELGLHSLIYIIGEIAARLASIILLPIFTRFLSKEDYGILEIIDSLRYLLVHILIVGFSPAMAKFYKEANDEQSRREVFGTSFIFILGSTLFWGGCFFLLNQPLSNALLGNSAFTSYINVGILLLCSQALTTIGFNYLTIRKQSKLYVSIKLSKMFFNIGINLYFIVILGLKAKGMLYGELVSNTILILVLCSYLVRHNGLFFRLDLAGRMLKFGLPMLPNMLSAVLMQRADRYLLRKFTSLADVGVYGIGYRFPYMLNYLVLSSFRRIWSTSVMYEIAKHDDYQRTYAKIATYFMTLYVTCQYILVVMAPTVMKVLVAPDYFGAWRVIQVVGLGQCVYALHSFFVVGAFVKSKTWYLPIAYLCAAFVNISFNWYFLPRYGYMAGAWNVVLTYCVFSFLTLFIFQRIYPIPFEFRRLGYLFGGGVFFVLLSNAFHLPHSILNGMKELAFALIFPSILFFGPYFDRDEKESLSEELQKIHPRLAAIYTRLALR